MIAGILPQRIQQQTNISSLQPTATVLVEICEQRACIGAVHHAI